MRQGQPWSVRICGAERSGELGAKVLLPLLQIPPAKTEEEVSEQLHHCDLCSAYLPVGQLVLTKSRLTLCEPCAARTVQGLRDESDFCRAENNMHRHYLLVRRIGELSE